MQLSLEWAEKYRPKVFGDVIGQGPSVAQLADMIRVDQPRSVLITGPTGSGKTTLARIYANALVCVQPAADGSPCLVCTNCRAFEEGTLPDFRLYRPERQSLEHIRDLIIDVQKYAPMFAEYRSILFDEAQDIHGGWDPLLQEIANPSSSSVFIFTTLDPGDVPVTIRDRLLPIALASALPVIPYLQRICAKEGVVYEDDALQLLADGSASFRRTIRDLQTTASRGAVNCDAVYEFVLNDRVGWVSHYLRAVVAGDIQAQLSAVASSTASPSEKQGQILKILTALQVRFVSTSRGAGRQAPTFIPDAVCVEFVDYVKALASASGLTLPRAWDGLLRFWVSSPARPSVEVLAAQIARFDSLLNAQPDSIGVDVVETVSVPIPAFRRSTPRRGVSQNSAPSDRKFMSAAQAKQIYDAATFSLQEWWAPFNVAAIMKWRADVEDRDAADLAGQFVHRLSERLKTWSAPGGFHHVVAHARFDGAMETAIVGHVPSDLTGRIEDWMRRPSVSSRWPASIGHSIKRPRSYAADAKSHWALVRQLWKSLDPTAVVDGVPLCELLGLTSTEFVRSEPITCRRYSISYALGGAARTRAAADTFDALSAWGDGAWEWLFQPWERDEHQRRAAERLKRYSEMAALSARFPKSSDNNVILEARSRSIVAQNQIDRAAPESQAVGCTLTEYEAKRRISLSEDATYYSYQRMNLLPT